MELEKHSFHSLGFVILFFFFFGGGGGGLGGLGVDKSQRLSPVISICKSKCMRFFVILFLTILYVDNIAIIWENL